MTSDFNSAQYASHSYWIGTATTAAHKGIQDLLIKILGCWESAAYTLYVRTPPEVLRGVAARMGDAGKIVSCETIGSERQRGH